MLYGRGESLEDRLVKHLLKGPAHVKDLHAKTKGEVSLRAIYKAVHVLIGQGVLIKVGKNIWINQEWLRILRNNLQQTLPLLARGEKVTYSFTSIAHLDAFWKTIVLQLEEHERDREVFFYNPHNFWAYIPERKESEDAYYKHFLDLKHHAYFTIGGNSHADMEFKRAYQNEFLQIDVRSVPSLGRNNHVTILGDFVISVRVEPGFATRLDELYGTNYPIVKILPEILVAYEETKHIKLIFEHNAPKAKKFRKILSQNFYFQR